MIDVCASSCDGDCRDNGRGMATLPWLKSQSNDLNRAWRRKNHQPQTSFRFLELVNYCVPAGKNENNSVKSEKLSDSNDGKKESMNLCNFDNKINQSKVFC